MATGRKDVRVSVLIPCFEDGAFLPSAVESVREEEPVEVVIVDDGSQDELTRRTLSDLAAREDVKVVRQERNRGVSVTRTMARKVASAPYLFTLDADDELLPGMLAPMADRLDADPGLDACYGDYQEIGTSNDVRRMPARLDAYRVAFINEYPTGAMFRASALEKVGAWRDALKGYEDWDVWMALAEEGLRAEHVGRGTVTWRYRQHEGRLLASARENHATLYDALRQSHPRLFSELSEHRRRSDLPWYFKAAFPVMYGKRPLMPGRSRVKRLIARTGIVDRIR